MFDPNFPENERHLHRMFTEGKLGRDPDTIFNWISSRMRAKGKSEEDIKFMHMVSNRYLSETHAGNGIYWGTMANFFGPHWNAADQLRR